MGCRLLVPTDDRCDGMLASSRIDSTVKLAQALAILVAAWDSLGSIAAMTRLQSRADDRPDPAFIKQPSAFPIHLCPAGRLFLKKPARCD